MKLLQLLAGRPAEVDVALPVATPTRVPAGQTVTVAADTQMLWRLPIRVDGGLVVLGALVQT